MDGIDDKEISIIIGIKYNTVIRYKERMKRRNNCESMQKLIDIYLGGNN
jgi:DNA-binding CsgD family transcriptional regulator